MVRTVGKHQNRMFVAHFDERSSPYSLYLTLASSISMGSSCPSCRRTFPRTGLASHRDRKTIQELQTNTTSRCNWTTPISEAGTHLSQGGTSHLSLASFSPPATLRVAPFCVSTPRIPWGTRSVNKRSLCLFIGIPWSCFGARSSGIGLTSRAGSLPSCFAVPLASSPG